MTDNRAPLNPEDIEAKLRELSGQIATMVRVVSDAYERFLTKDHAYDLAYAKAYGRSDGSVDARKQACVIACETERTERDAADVAYRYANQLAKAKESELNAYQSVGAMIREVYRGQGRG